MLKDTYVIPIEINAYHPMHFNGVHTSHVGEVSRRLFVGLCCDHESVINKQTIWTRRKSKCRRRKSVGYIYIHVVYALALVVFLALVVVMSNAESMVVQCCERHDQEGASEDYVDLSLNDA